MRKYISKINNIINSFKVIEDFGLQLTSSTCIKPASMVRVICLGCNSYYEGQYTHFKYGGRKCLKCNPRVIHVKKFYTNEIHGNFKIIKDLIGPDNKNKLRRVVAQCLKCHEERESSYSVFKRKRIVCKCKLEKSAVWKRISKIRLGMLDRCYNFQNKSFHRYGGRGIAICKEWINSCLAFYEWSMNNSYADHLTIDRINNDGNYEPSNCRWATSKEQALNKRPEYIEASLKILEMGRKKRWSKNN